MNGSKTVNTALRLVGALLAAFILLASFSAAARAGKIERQAQAAGTNSTSPDPAPVALGEVQVQPQADGSLVMTLETGGYSLRQGPADAGACQQLDVAGYGVAAGVGAPALPVKGALMGIPAQGLPRLEVVEAVREIVPGRFHVCPVAEPVAERDEHGLTSFAGYRYHEDPALYGADAFTGGPVALLQEPALVRSQRVAQVRFQPFEYNPVTGELAVYRRIQVRVVMPAPAARPSAMTRPVAEPAAFEDNLRSTLVNYDQSKLWRSAAVRTAAVSRPSAPGAITGSGPGYKVVVDQTGLYRITYADLLAAGVDSSELAALDPLTLRLTGQGRDIPVWVDGETDGHFDASDIIWFYGLKSSTRWTAENVYWLTWGGQPGARMRTQTATPSGGLPVAQSFTDTVRIEQGNGEYQSARPSQVDGDRFYWWYMYASGSTKKNYRITFSLAQVYTAPFTATLGGDLMGYAANPKHLTRFFLNSGKNLVDEALWNSDAEYVFSRPVTGTWIKEGSNVISVTLPMSLPVTGDRSEQFWLNWFDVTYARKFVAAGNALNFRGAAGDWGFEVRGFTTSTLEVLDVTDPYSPTRLLGVAAAPAQGGYQAAFDHSAAAERRYYAAAQPQWRSVKRLFADTPSDLHNPTNAADYLIISYGSFITATQPLSQARSAQGYTVKTVDVQDIYDEFNAGNLDPQAIHDFLKYAYANWSAPKAAYVLLVGDGTVDPLGNFGLVEPEYIPPLLDDVDLWIGETATDNRFAAVSGNDRLPDLYVGRFPARSALDVTNWVSKTLAYEQTPAPGDWNRKLMFIADNPDSAGDFHYFSDQVANNYVPTPYVVDKIYMPYIPYGQQPISYRYAITTGLNEGRLMVSYIGHSGYQPWAAERLMDPAKLKTVNNGLKLPFVTPMTCSEGYFINPSLSNLDLSSMAESFIRKVNGGAIATFSPTGFGVAHGHDFMERGLYIAIFKDYVNQIGPATNQAKLFLYAQTGTYLDLVETYMVFGDPAVRLPVARPQMSLNKMAMAPAGLNADVSRVVFRMTFTNTGEGMATHLALNDALPAWAVTGTYTASLPAGQASLRPGSPFVFDLPDLAPGATGVLTLTLAVAPSAWGGFTNTASIVSPGDLSQANHDSTAVARFYNILIPLIRK